MAQPDVQQRLRDAGVEPMLGDAPGLAREIEDYYANWVPQSKAIMTDTGVN